MNFKDQKNIVETYKRYDLVLERGEGVYLFSMDGVKFLDFSSGIGVCALGYANKEFNEDLKIQIDKILHTSNLYFNENIARAASNLSQNSGLERVFFTNSGTEAIEGAMKAARKYTFEKGKKGRNFIAFKNSFHGRTLGALSLTHTPKYRAAFKPLISKVEFAEFNEIKSVERLISEKTCAIVLESVQGEGGIKPAKSEFYKALRELCDEKDILLIADEIQSGMGRSGEFFAYQNFKILPDIMACAKALGNGVSVGAFLLSQKVARNSLKAGDHGSTYGGNPFACAAINSVFEIIKKQNLLENVRKMSVLLEKSLNELKAEFSFILEQNGLGLMQGLKIDKKIKANEIIKKTRENGLLILPCGANDLRFLPPFIINSAHIDEMYEKLRKALKSF